MPRLSIASRNPRLVMTVTTTLSPASAPRSCRSMAQMAMMWSPSTSSPAASTRSTRSASPSKATPTSAPSAATLRASSSGWVEPQPALMFVPSGSAWMTSTSTPSSDRTPGATTDADPWAQSTTARSPAKSRPPSVPDTAARYPACAEAETVRTAPTPAPVGASGGRPGAASPSRRWSSSSSRSSTSSASLRPPAANSLMPLSANGLCDAETTAAGAPAVTDHQATSGVGATPSSSTSAPSLTSPAHRAASSIGPERRVSRPMAKRSPPSTRAAARPSASASSGVRSALATPRTPSVPNFSMNVGPGAPGAGSALGVLGGLPGLLEPVLLRLLLALVTRQEAGPLERGAHLGVELDQGAGDAEPQRTRLARHPAADEAGVDVVGALGVDDAQRLREDHLVGLGREVGGDVAVIDGDGPRAGTDADPGDGALAAAGGLRERCGHVVSSYQAG